MAARCCRHPAQNLWLPLLLLEGPLLLVLLLLLLNVLLLCQQPDSLQALLLCYDGEGGGRQQVAGREGAALRVLQVQ